MEIGVGLGISILIMEVNVLVGVRVSFMKMTHVVGKKKGEIFLYGLSTCGWCGKTKKLLDDLGVEYSFVYVDLLEGQERREAMKEVERHNPTRSFPTTVINGKSVVGYKEDEIKEALSA